MTDLNSPPLRVLLADDHPVLLAGVRALIGADAGLEVIAEATDGIAALALAVQTRPDVAVIDISMPRMNGFELASAMAAKCPDCKLLVLTVHEDRVYARQLLESGVAGYLLKRSAADEICRAIRTVHEGGTYLDPAIAGALIDRHAPASASVPTPDANRLELSEREADVLRLTANGYSNKVIASRLTIGLKTVETYKARAMAKLNFHSRAEIVRYAVSVGWLHEDDA